MSEKTIEFDLVRLTAQSSGPNPKEPGGGMPEYSRAEIMALIAEVPHMAFHALMAKYCGDELSIKALLEWLHRKSIAEWFTNPEHATKKIEARELRRLVEVSLLSWLNPRSPQATNYETRGAYLNCSADRFKRVFQSHHCWIQGELGYLEQLGIRVHASRKYGPKKADG